MLVSWATSALLVSLLSLGTILLLRVVWNDCALGRNLQCIRRRRRERVC